MLGPPGWFPDPSGSGGLRWFDGSTWTEWVSHGGQVGTAVLSPPATGGGTLVTEPVLLTALLGGGSFAIRTPSGVDLALAADADGQRRRLEVTDPAGRSVLRLRRTGLGSSATVSARLAAGDGPAEIGRYEAAAGAVRVLAHAALVATIPVPGLGTGAATIVDPSNRPLARLERRHDSWQTELARPLGDPLHPLLALASLAVTLLEA